MRPNNPRRLGPRILRLASHRTSTVVWSARLVSAVVLLVFFFFSCFEINRVDSVRGAPLHQVCGGLRGEHLVRIDPHSSC